MSCSRTAAPPTARDEGYTLRVGRFFTVTAPHTAGIFYGGRTLLALIRGHRPIPRGSGRDVPRYPERGLMLDCAAPSSPANGCSPHPRAERSQLNLLHLHMSDDQGFRVETPSHPEIDTRPFLTRADVAALVAEAKRRHVTIVPEVGTCRGT